MDSSHRPIAIGGMALLLVLAGCLSGATAGQPQSPTASPTTSQTAAPTTSSPTPTTPASASTTNCPDGVSFYGLDSPDETAWAPDRIAIGYTVPANASVFFVAFEEGTVVGSTHVTTGDLDHGVTADGDGIPLETTLNGSHVIRVGVYADTNHDGEFDYGTDAPCRSDGEPVEAGPRRIDFSEIQFEPDRTTTNGTSTTESAAGSSGVVSDEDAKREALDAEQARVNGVLANATNVSGSAGVYGQPTASVVATKKNAVLVAVEMPYSYEYDCGDEGGAVDGVTTTAVYRVTPDSTTLVRITDDVTLVCE